MKCFSLYLKLGKLAICCMLGKTMCFFWTCRKTVWFWSKLMVLLFDSLNAQFYKNVIDNVEEFLVEIANSFPIYSCDSYSWVIAVHVFSTALQC